MGQSVSPVNYRTGFFRVWDSLFTKDTHITAFNYAAKSQVLGLYAEGFFRRWLWDGKRSFFLNYVYSHAEVHWSSRALRLNVYYYDTTFQCTIHRLHRQLQRFSGSADPAKDHWRSADASFVGSDSVRNRLMAEYFLRMLQLLRRVSSADTATALGSDFFRRPAFSQSRQIAVESALWFRQRLAGQLPLRLFTGPDLVQAQIFFGLLLRLRFYRTALGFFTEMFRLRPFEGAFRRFLLKDLYGFLGLAGITSRSVYPVRIRLVRLSPAAITADLLGRHIWLKLRKQYGFGAVVQGLLRKFRRLSLFAGMLFRCRGRFTKKQRAWNSRWSSGRVPLGSQFTHLDDSLVMVRLRYGMASVRININCPLL